MAVMFIQFILPPIPTFWRLICCGLSGSSPNIVNKRAELAWSKTHVSYITPEDHLLRWVVMSQCHMSVGVSSQKNSLFLQLSQRKKILSIFYSKYDSFVVGKKIFQFACWASLCGKNERRGIFRYLMHSGYPRRSFIWLQAKQARV